MIIKHKETHMTIVRTFQRAALVMRKNSPLTNSKSQLSDKKRIELDRPYVCKRGRRNYSGVIYPPFLNEAWYVDIVGHV